MIRLAAVLALMAGPAVSACYNPQHLAAFLKLEHGLTLHSWGLNDAGNEEQLWLNSDGHWAVVETTPQRCSDIASMPHKLRGALTNPPRNPAMRPGPMIPGWPM